MLGEGVDGAADGLACFKFFELLDHEVGLKGVGVVIVLLAALFKGKVLVLIVAVVVDNADIIAEVLLQMLGERRFARAGAACNADKNGVHCRILRVCRIFYCYRVGGAEKQGGGSKFCALPLTRGKKTSIM